MAAGLEGRERLRLTETAPEPAAAGARSTFHAGGNGTVGLQSIRGMPFPAELRRAGVAVWPFDVRLIPAHRSSPRSSLADDRAGSRSAEPVGRRSAPL